MSILTYSLKKDGNKKLSENFKVKEFRCKDGSDKILVSTDTVKILQRIREYFGQPVSINSAYRTQAYNKKVGGAINSQHVKGTACDIKVKSVPPKAVAAFIEAIFPTTGIGLYSTFVHVDTRGRKVRWKDNGNNVVGSFGLGDIYKIHKAKPQEVDEMVTDRSITIFGKQYETKGILKEGSNYISPRVLKEAGFDVGNQGSEPIISMPTVRLEVSGKEKKITGFSSNGVTYAGVRQIAEALGHEVDWDNESKTVIIR